MEDVLPAETLTQPRELRFTRVGDQTVTPNAMAPCCHTRIQGTDRIQILGLRHWRPA
jgi:hypothetical protein